MWKQLRLKITRNYHLAKNKTTGKYVRCIIHRLRYSAVAKNIIITISKHKNILYNVIYVHPLFLIQNFSTS